MNDIKEMTEALIKFRDQRDWEQFHNSKDLALAISIEAGELNELFLWKKAEDVNVEKLKNELADVLAFSLLLANKHNLDVKQIVLDKIKSNGEKYPIDKISDVYRFDKYGNQHSQLLMYWSLVQLFTTLGLIIYLFGNIGTIGLPNIFVYGLFVFLTVYSYTELMDTLKFSVFWEGLRFLFSIGIIYFYGDWFGMSTLLPFSNVMLITYFSLSLFMSSYFVFVEFRKTQNSLSYDN